MVLLARAERLVVAVGDEADDLTGSGRVEGQLERLTFLQHRRDERYAWGDALTIDVEPNRAQVCSLPQLLADAHGDRNLARGR